MNNNRKIKTQINMIRKYREKKNLCLDCGYYLKDEDHECIENYIKSDTRDLSEKDLKNDPEKRVEFYHKEILKDFKEIKEEVKDENMDDIKILKKEKKGNIIVFMNFTDIELVNKDINLFLERITRTFKTFSFYIKCENENIIYGKNSFYNNMKKIYNICFKKINKNTLKNLPNVVCAIVNEIPKDAVFYKNSFIYVPNKLKTSEKLITSLKNFIME